MSIRATRSLQTLLGIVWVAVSVATVSAQPSDTLKIRHDPLFTRRDAWIAGGFVVGTIALTYADEPIAKNLQEPSAQANRFFRHTASQFRWMGSPGPYIIGPSLYLIGTIGRVPRAADLGLHGTEAVLLALGVTDLTKGLAGRARPYVAGDTNPRDFSFGRGFRNSQDYVSFPSGHTTAAFAAAAAVSAETQQWWPKTTWIIGPLMYGGATMVGLSRMYNNAHWASDVAMGAAIGTFAGLKVVLYQHSHPNNFIDRVLLRASIAKMPDGAVALAWNAY